MVAPLAPHIAEELWARLGHADTLAYEPFPVADPHAGWSRRRSRCRCRSTARCGRGSQVAVGADAAAHEAAARADAAHRRTARGRDGARGKVVPGSIVNFVVG